MDMVKKPLLAAPAPEEYIAVTSDSSRNWSGHLLCCFGKGDQNGFSSYAYAKFLPPLAWGHNVQRAFNWSHWKHALVYMLLLSMWGYSFFTVFSIYAMECRSDEHHQLPITKHQPEANLPHMKEQQFLTGSTYNPAFAAKKDAVKPWESKPGMVTKSYDLVTLDPMENPALQIAKTNSQIEEAKNQGVSGMAQLGGGRKLLHKHDDDSDDEEKRVRKAAKKEKKLKDKLARKEEEAAEEEDDDEQEPHDDHYAHGPGTPACMVAARMVIYWAMGMFVCSLIGTIYAIRVRTAMRTKFGIPGSECKDAAAWMCCAPCALCQETRTLSANNVQNGVWFGKTVFAAPAAHPLHPAVQQAAPTKS